MLRPFTLEDVDALHILWTGPDMRRYLWDDLVISGEKVAKVVENHLITAETDGIGYWAIRFSDSLDAPLVGFCGFRFQDDTRDIELLYGLDVAHWGRGFATEASAAAINHLWSATSLVKVYARADTPNHASVKVMERLGMTHVSSSAEMITYVLFKTEGDNDEQRQSAHKRR
jgi:ribosomal-protein-alanine N-acetyltransferase